MTTQQTRKRKAAAKAAIYGIGSIALYAAMFSYADEVISFIAKGGARAVAPVGVVFLFSWVHGSFAGNFWSALGIEAARKSQRKAVEAPARPARQVRATVSA